MDDTQSPDPIIAELATDDTQPTITDSTAVETEGTEAPAEDTVETTEENNESEAETEPEVEQPEEEAEAEEEDLQPSEAEEVDPKEEARRRYEERQKSIAERNARIQEQSKDYVEGAEDEYDQRLRAMEVQQYAAKIEQNENSLVTEFERVKANPDLQIFNPENKELFNERAYDKAIRDYNAGYVEYDQYGNMIGIKGSLFEHLTETADLLKSAVNTGAVQQVRATKQMKANADTKPAATPRETPKDDILDILKSDD